MAGNRIDPPTRPLARTGWLLPSWFRNTHCGRAEDRSDSPIGSMRRKTSPGFVALVCLLNGCALIARRGTIAYLAVTAQLTDMKLQVNKEFIERYKNRVTIHTTFAVDRAMESPLPAFLDGDLHLAGRAPQIGLPTVGEIANAASQKEAVDIVHRAEDTRKPLKVSGVWRVWPEHAASKMEEQGSPLPPYETSNPEQVFEIHPVTRINDTDLLDSFRPVEGFKPGGAQRTFGIYEKASCRLKVEPKTVSIFTATGLYNDVEFIMELADDRQLVVADGRFVIASARDLDGGLLVEHLRMVFVKGTGPERAVRLLKRGDRLHVYGIPRLDFAEISRRVRESGTNLALLTGRLPYEIIIIGVYPNGK
jgi:hypothetical protein